MFLNEPPPTPFDLRWRMLGTPIRVSPWFWLMSVLLGYDVYFASRGGGFGLLALWVGCVFVSILLHEFGHVLVGRAFGSFGHIILYSFGGLAIGSKNLERRWQRMAVSFAGPGAQLLLLAALWGLWNYTPLPRSVPADWRRSVVLAYLMLFEINLFWPLLNLLPIWPLDGGQITRELCEGVQKRGGVITSLWISVIVSTVLALLVFLQMADRQVLPFRLPVGWWMGIFFVMFAYTSFQALQMEQSRNRWFDGDDAPWR